MPHAHLGWSINDDFPVLADHMARDHADLEIDETTVDNLGIELARLHLEAHLG